MIKFGQSSFVYFNHSLQDAIIGLGEAGYDCIEIWGGRPHYYRRDLDDQLPEILELLEKYRMSVPNFIPAQFRYPSVLCSLNEKIRKDSVAYIKDNIDTAIKLNAASISLCPGVSLKGESIEKAKEQLGKSILDILDYVQGEALHVLIEPAHKWETTLIYTIDDTVEFIGELGNNPQLGVCLDTGHLNINGESFAHAIQIANHLPLHIHMDDNNGDMDAHMIPGMGSIDFVPLVTALNKANYQGCISAELGFQYTLEPQQAIEKTLGELKKIFI